eukprot:NODE_752_length_4215_cov_0.325559.p6 type:complete len:100 gc:universal NODE_752_length_4215_cov_0.325559:2699-2998(+)
MAFRYRMTNTIIPSLFSRYNSSPFSNCSILPSINVNGSLISDSVNSNRDNLVLTLSFSLDLLQYKSPYANPKYFSSSARWTVLSSTLNTHLSAHLKLTR